MIDFICINHVCVRVSADVAKMGAVMALRTTLAYFLSKEIKVRKSIFTYCNIVLCCAELWCIVLYCTVLRCTALYFTVLYCTVLYCTVLYCTVLCRD